MTCSSPYLELHTQNPIQLHPVRHSCSPRAVSFCPQLSTGEIGRQSHLSLVTPGYGMTIDTEVPPSASGPPGRCAGGCGRPDQRMCPALTPWVLFACVDDTELADVEKELCRLPAV